MRMPSTRQLRGTLRTSLLWASGFAVTSLAMTMRWWLRWSTLTPDAHAQLVKGFAVWTGVGLCAGGLFSVVVIARARGLSLQQLSARRAGLWGFASSAVAFGLVALLAMARDGYALPFAARLAIVSGTAGVLGLVAAGGGVRLAQRRRLEALGASSQPQLP